MMFPVVRAIALMALLMPAMVQAGPLKLVFGAGVVTIDAQDVPLGAILDQWAKLGGTRIDGMDKLPEVTVTFHVEGIPEDEALAALLNKRNGYSTVPRKAGEAGASQFSRIAVLSPTKEPITRPSAVPKDWPFPVNENPDGVEPQPPRSDVVIERLGIEVPWPFEINDTPPEVPPLMVPVDDLARPGVDVPWPFPINLQPTLDLDPPTTELRDPTLKVWPFPINPNPADPDSPAIDPAAKAVADQGAAEKAAADKASADKASADKAAADKAKTKGAPVSTKAPKPIPPGNPPPKRPGR